MVDMYSTRISAMAPDDARQDRARVAQLADDAVDRHEHEDEHQFGAREQLEDPLPRGHREFPPPSAPAVLSVLPPTSRSSSWLSRSGRSLAMRSMTFRSSAFSAVMAVLSTHGRPGPLDVAIRASRRWPSMKLPVIVLQLLLHHVAGFLLAARRRWQPGAPRRCWCAGPWRRRPPPA